MTRRLHRFRYRRFTLISAVSLLLCVVMMAVCVGTGVVGGTFWQTASDRRQSVVLRTSPETMTILDRRHRIDYCGFGCTEERTDVGPDEALGRERVIWWLPWWPLILATALLPACWVVSNREVWLPRVTQLLPRNRRIRHGLCPRCGYDLRATPGRCPECGTPAGKGAS